VSLKIGKEKMDKLYALEKHGVPRTHLEVLMWFDVHKGEVVDLDTIQGKKVGGRNKAGNLLQRRAPIPANDIVNGLHYIHGGVRGSYKPGGAKLVGYDKTRDPPQIWEGKDQFIQAIQTGDDTLDGYGKEITFDEDRNWLKIDYDHDAKTHEKTPYTEITKGELQRCYDNKIPIGIIYIKSEQKYEIIGLGMITKISKNKLNYTIKPYDWNSKINSQFQFVKKDFNCKETKEDAQYRWKRFKDLYDAVVPQLGSRFDIAKNDVGLKAESTKRKSSYFGRYYKRGETVYYNYTWFGILLVTPEPNASKAKKDFQFPSRDTVQFQIGLNPRDPLWAGIFIGRSSGSRKTRERMISLLKNEPEECIKRFKDLSGYVIMCYSGKTDTDSRLVGRWETSELTRDIVNEIFKIYSEKNTDFRIVKIFTKVEALES